MFGSTLRASNRLTSVLFSLAILLTLATTLGCSDTDESVGDVDCGNKTCGPDQYCQIQQCCGSDVGFDDAGNWRGSPSYSCIDVPDECSSNDACNCDSVCDCKDDRTVSCPAV